ncbi:MAG: TerB family tellurite resistance protein [Bacteroidetes bacterium]|nr:TerB family tellurite resistance protein [Bacteroidota bacterium]
MRFIFYIILGIVIIYWVRSLNKTGGNAKRAEEPKDNKPGNAGNGYAKWIGGGLGWAFGGPIGGILGFAFGKMFEDMKGGIYAHKGTGSADFNVSLLILSAAVMKADDSVKRSELEYVKDFYVRNFGLKAAEQYILMLREILKQEINLQEVCQQIGHYMDYPAKLQLLHYIFGLGQADGAFHAAELDVIGQIASLLGISKGEFDSIRAMFIKETDSAYKILEIESTATDEEVKKAFREMARKYHPDKVSHLGDDVRKAAEQKFQEVANAYDKIKQERGLK